MLFPMLLFSAICVGLVLVGLHNLPKRRVSPPARRRTTAYNKITLYFSKARLRSVLFRFGL
jgi:hypothetical protein